MNFFIKRYWKYGIIAACILIVLASWQVPFAFMQTQSTNIFHDKQTEDKTVELKGIKLILQDEQMRETQPEILVRAIQRAGQLKDESVVNDLVKQLTFKRKFNWEDESAEVSLQIHPITPAGRYPAIGALILIGEPALPILAETIAINDINSLAGQNALVALQSIFRDFARSENYLRQWAINAPAFESQQRLLDAAEKTKQQWLKLEELKTKEKKN